jgi:hypothetical protein
VRRLTLILTLAITAGAALAAPASRPAAGSPRCFGAAARDPRHPCSNPRLRFSVFPTPTQAAITPNAPCEPLERRGFVTVCGFGVPAGEAIDTVALVGDSHAMHWRAALAVVAQAKRWQALSIARTACVYSRAVRRAREPRRTQCVQWTQAVVTWFAAHPEVHTVFVAELTSTKGVIGVRGPDTFAAEVRGYRDAWRALPASVEHIVVIRDTPRITAGTLPCVARAMRAHARAGVVCSVSRRAALRRDPAAVAVDRMRSPRVRAIRLTHFLCGRRACYPVVGGVLVYKDQHHLTRVFATTLGPFLARAVDTLMAGWGR